MVRIFQSGRKLNGSVCTVFIYTVYRYQNIYYIFIYSTYGKWNKYTKEWYYPTGKRLKSPSLGKGVPEPSLQPWVPSKPQHDFQQWLDPVATSDLSYWSVELTSTVSAGHKTLEIIVLKTHWSEKSHDQRHKDLQEIYQWKWYQDTLV